jgi:hypothetical protein
MKTTDAEFEAKMAAINYEIEKQGRIIAQEQMRKFREAKDRKPLIRWPWSK